MLLMVLDVLPMATFIPSIIPDEVLRYLDGSIISISTSI